MAPCSDCDLNKVQADLDKCRIAHELLPLTYLYQTSPADLTWGLANLTREATTARLYRQDALPVPHPTRLGALPDARPPEHAYAYATRLTRREPA